jgi:hypothetical protein
LTGSGICERFLFGQKLQQKKWPEKKFGSNKKKSGYQFLMLLQPAAQFLSISNSMKPN